MLVCPESLFGYPDPHGDVHGNVLGDFQASILKLVIRNRSDNKPDTLRFIG